MKELNTFSFIKNGNEVVTVNARYAASGITIKKCEYLGLNYTGAIQFEEPLNINGTVIHYAQFITVFCENDDDGRTGERFAKNKVSLLFYDGDDNSHGPDLLKTTWTQSQADHVTAMIEKAIIEHGQPPITLNLWSQYIVK